MVTVVLRVRFVRRDLGDAALPLSKPPDSLSPVIGASTLSQQKPPSRRRVCRKPNYPRVLGLAVTVAAISSAGCGKREPQLAGALPIAHVPSAEPSSPSAPPTPSASSPSPSSSTPSASSSATGGLGTKSLNGVVPGSPSRPPAGHHVPVKGSPPPDDRPAPNPAGGRRAPFDEGQPLKIKVKQIAH